MHDNNRNGVALAELPDMASTSPDQWKAFGLQLLNTIAHLRADIESLREIKQERDQLKVELAKLQVERDQYLKALHALTYEHFDIDKETLLAQLGQRPTIEEIINELKSSEAS